MMIYSVYDLVVDLWELVKDCDRAVIEYNHDDLLTKIRNKHRKQVSYSTIRAKLRRLKEAGAIRIIFHRHWEGGLVYSTPGKVLIYKYRIRSLLQEYLTVEKTITLEVYMK